MRFATASDAELLAASVSSPEAFGVFYERYEAPVLQYFRRRTSQPDVAIDLVAETFAAALSSAPRFNPRVAPASAWLFGIARNVLAESWRRGRVEDRARRRLGMPRLDLTDDMLERVESLADSSSDVLALLRDLPEAQRRALEARVIDELRYPEVARELACSEAVARKRVSRGLMALRARLEVR